MYEIKLDDFVFPLAAEKLDIVKNAKVNEMHLLNGNTMYFPQNGGLAEIKLEMLLPRKWYPFAFYGKEGYKPAEYYINKISDMIDKKRNVSLKIKRKDHNGKKMDETNYRVFVLNYTAVEDVENGCDIEFSLTLKEYNMVKSPPPVIVDETAATTQNDGVFCPPIALKHVEPQAASRTVVKVRETDNKPVYTTYTVVKGDCLSSIAEKCMGDGSKYMELYYWNQELIDKGNFGTGNPRFTIYAGQVLNIPKVNDDVLITDNYSLSLSHYNSASTTDNEEASGSDINPVTSIRLSRDKLDLLLNEEYNIYAMRTPSYSPTTVKWSSDNSNIASVYSSSHNPSACKIIAKKGGTVIISASANRVSAGCEVRVKPYSNIGTDEYFEYVHTESVKMLKETIQNSKYKEYNIPYPSLEEMYLKCMMKDINEYENRDSVPLKYWDKFCNFFNSYVYNVDTKELHYFRNKLNRVPRTLNDLLKEKDKWTLLNEDMSELHMYGKDGEYNLKFISYNDFPYDGKFEAVYNKNGILLTEINDPVNMGTYNYRPSPNQIHIDSPEHVLFDVYPWIKWNNVPNEPEKGENRKSFTLLSPVKEYRDKYKYLIQL